MDFVSVYVTCPDEDTAARIGRDLVGRKLAACANILPGMRSLYRWEGAVQDEREVAMFLKTRRALVPDVERAVKALHPYEVPCIVAFELVAGNTEYLAWIDQETRG